MIKKIKPSEKDNLKLTAKLPQSHLEGKFPLKFDFLLITTDFRESNIKEPISALLKKVHEVSLSSDFSTIFLS